MKYTDTIKKLNILNETLKDDYIDWGALEDTEDPVVEEVLSEIREFLESRIDVILNPSKQQQQSVIGQFNDQQALVLKELADKALARAGVQPPEGENVNDPTPPRTPKELPESPVMTALRNNGFDPDASPEDRVKAVKEAEKANKEKSNAKRKNKSGS